MKQFQTFAAIPLIVLSGCGIAFRPLDVGSNVSSQIPGSTTQSIQSLTTWQNFSIGQNSQPFALDFDVIPSQDNMLGILTISQNPSSSSVTSSVAIRFNDSGKFDALNASAFDASNVIPYSAHLTYHFHIDVNTLTDFFTVHVTPSGGGQSLVAESFPFRASANVLQYFGIQSPAGNLIVSKLVVGPYSLPLNQTIAGSCGDAKNDFFTSAPSAKLCGIGSPSGMAGSGPFTWTCSGINGGVSASCTAGFMLVGACGSANNVSVSSPPAAGLCAAGTASAVTGSGPFDWTCVGTNGGSFATCTAPLKNAGRCGNANNLSVATTPVANLCDAGTPSTVTGMGPFNWNCNGTNGGPSVSCSAQLQNSGSTLFGFDHVIIVVLENASYPLAVADTNLLAFAQKGALLTNYWGVSHPSAPNYIAMTAGSDFGVTDDNIMTYNQKSIADLLEAKNMNWKNYAEGYGTPSDCPNAYSPVDANHVPFLSFANINTNLTRCHAHIVDSSNFKLDIQNRSLPAYSMYSPDTNNDGHDTSVAYAGSWFTNTIEPILANPNLPPKTLVVLVFDEGETGDQIYAAFYGSMVKPGSQAAELYNHYNLLRTIEDNFGLGNLGQHDVTAKPITGIWANGR